MKIRKCNLQGIMDVWSDIYEAQSNLEDLGEELIDSTISRLERALENLNDACDITDEDVTRYT